MKKVLLLILSAFLMGTSIYAKERIPLTVSWEDDTPIGNGQPKSPVHTPTVYIEDYMLSFVANHPEYILSIKDEDGEVVYTTTVFSTDTQVALPSTFSGDYTIELRMGSWVFKGWINL